MKPKPPLSPFALARLAKAMTAMLIADGHELTGPVSHQYGPMSQERATPCCTATLDAKPQWGAYDLTISWWEDIGGYRRHRYIGWRISSEWKLPGGLREWLRTVCDGIKAGDRREHRRDQKRAQRARLASLGLPRPPVTDEQRKRWREQKARRRALLRERDLGYSE